MSFISKHIQGSKLDTLLQDVELITQNSELTFTWLEHLKPNKKERYEEYKDLIRIHMPVLLKEDFTPDKFQPKKENNGAASP